jgi:Family of unknown function (DUF6084)
MPDLSFEIIGAGAPPFAAVPTLIFKLRITNMPAENHIHSISLRSQIQIAVNRRRYSAEAQSRLLELFGEPCRWSDTLRPLLWTHSNTVIPQFSKNVVVDLPISCTYDFEVATTKYFDALEDGEVPLHFLFSGTTFYKGKEAHLQVEQIPWSREAFYRLPVAVWKEMIARYYPNSAWLRLHKDIFNQLYQYKATHSLPTWEAVVTHLLQVSSQATNMLHTTIPTNELQIDASDEEIHS